MKKLGLIGLGAVGHRLAIRLLEHFGELDVLDVDLDKATALVERGATISANPRTLAGQADILLLSLPSPSAVSNVMEGPDGILAGIGHGTIVLDTSTLDPDASVAWASATSRCGGHYLDAPMTCSVTSGGGTAAAERGELTFLVGGDVSPFEEVRHVLESLGRCVHHLGPAGSGSVMKLVSNHISGIQTLAIAEALNLAEVCGFSPHHTLDICADTVANSYVLESVVKARLDNPEGTAHFAIELMGKDHRLARTLAEKHGVAMPMNDVALELCDAMCEAGYARRDNVASVEYFAGLNRQPADE